MDRSRQLDRETSLYLDAVRFTAAMAVLIDHMSLGLLTDGLFWQFQDFGHEAVTVFFVLSGFVIGYVTDTTEKTPRVYVISRASRIYSVALPALLITLILDALGRGISPGLYPEDWGYSAQDRITQFAAGITFTHGVWDVSIWIGSMRAYWSMCNEVWYYIAFGLWTYCPRKWRAPAACLAVLAVGPSVASMFPIWLMGVAAWRIGATRAVSRPAGWALFLGSIAIWAGYETYAAWHGRAYWLVQLPYIRREFAQDYLIGVVFAANLVGFQAVSDRAGKPLTLAAGPIRWLAGATFSIYLFHESVAMFLRSLMPWPAGSAISRVLVVGGTIAAVLLLAEATERRKAIWRRGFAALIGGAPAKRREPA